MIPTQAAIETVSARLLEAYLRNQVVTPTATEGVRQACRTAAEGLLVLHQSRPRVPLDPELFVATQRLRSRSQGDPWVDLATSAAFGRYREVVREVARSLRAEIRQELRRIRRWSRRGLSLEVILENPSIKASPLARYIAAHRAQRPDLASQYVRAAELQHRSCPLYRVAASRFLPPGLYPEDRTRAARSGTTVPVGVN